MTADVAPGVGRLTLGAANAGNLYAAMTDRQAGDLFEAAWEVGIRAFDTAPHYGLGLSERRLGAFLSGMPRAEFTVSTKVGRLLRDNPAGAGRLDDEYQFAVPATLRRVWDASARGVRASLGESLERLGLERVDTLYLHDPEEYALDASLASALPELAAMRREGLVDAVGVGSKSVAALLASAAWAQVDTLMVAGRHTLLDQSAAAALLPRCAARRIRVAAASVFNSGLLSRPEPDESGRFDYARVPAGVLQRARELARVCARVGTDLPTAALHFPLRDPSVTTVVVGAATADQVRQNAARLAAPPPAELWSALAEAGLVREAPR